MGISRYEKDLNEREEANQRFALGADGYRLFKAAGGARRGRGSD